MLCFPRAHSQGINLHPFWKEISRCKAKYGSAKTTLNRSSLDQAELRRKSSKANGGCGFQMWATHWTQKRKTQSLTRWVYCTWSHGRGIHPAAEWWLKELGKLETVTEDTLLYKKDLHFTSIQYLDTRILQKASRPQFMSIDLGLLEKRKCQTVSCGRGHQQKLIYEWWDLKNDWKWMFQCQINKTKLKYRGLEDGTGISLMCIAKNCKDLAVTSYNKTLQYIQSSSREENSQCLFTKHTYSSPRNDNLFQP